MPNTPKGLTYPSNASPVAVPADIQELATDVDNIIVPISGGTYSGAVAFLQNPSVPTPTSALHAVNKTYADSINADVTALENELGANPSGTFSTVVERLDTYTDGFGKIGNLLTADQAALSTTGLRTLTGCTEGAAGVFTSNTTGVFGARYNISSGVTPGETYTFEATIAPVGRGMHVYAQFYEAGPGALLGSFSGNTIAVGSSGRSRVTAVAPASAGYIRFYAAYGASGNSGDTVTVSSIGYWKGASGTWAMPGTPVVGQSSIASNGAVHLSGTGTPAGVITAAPGSTFLQTDSVTDVKGWIRWVKATGTGSTGWVAGPEADTGWRDVSGSLSNLDGSNAGTLKVARRGSRVVWEFSNLLLASGSGALALWTSIPTGFRADKPIFASGSAHRINSQVYLQSVAVNSTAISWNSETNLASGAATATRPAVGITGQMSYDVISGWPTSLPGVAG